MTQRPLSVSLAQFNSAYGGKLYFPFSVGLIRAHAEGAAASRDRVAFLPLEYELLDVAETAARMAAADVAGFSSYSWNWRKSLAVAEALSAINPACLVVLGGPSVPDEIDGFFAAHPFVDVLCHGEGEATFADLLDAVAAGHAISGIPGTTARDRATGAVQAAPRRPRFKILDAIPSPYLSGVFDPLLAARPDMEWMALWETNRGCPYSCTFCEWGGADTTKLRRFDMARLEAEIRWFADKRIGWIFGCDANFGILDRDADIAERLAAAKEAHGYPKEFRVCYTKNANRRILDVAGRLEAAGMAKGVSVSMQSLNADTLEKVKRVNIGSGDFAELQREFLARGIATFTELILALPGETHDSFADGLERLLEMGQHSGINIYNCSILPNSEMARPDYQRTHGIQSVEIPVFQPHSTPGQGGPVERERIAVATASLPVADWRRVQRFAWAVQCFHLLGLLQSVALFLRHAAGVGYRAFYEACIADGLEKPASQIGRELRRLDGVLDNVLAGAGFDQVVEGFGDITWPHEEAAYLRLAEDRDAFYAENRVLVDGLAGGTVEPELLNDLFRYQAARAKHYDAKGGFELALGWPLHEYVEGCRLGVPPKLKPAATRYWVRVSPEMAGDKARFAQDVVWFGRKGGQYLYPVEPR